MLLVLQLQCVSMMRDHKVLYCVVPVRFWCTPRTVGRTLGSSPGTAGDTRGASCRQLRCCPPSPPDPEHIHNASRQTSRQATHGQRSIGRRTDLLVFGHRVQQLHVQFWVVLSEGLVAVMVDELHHGAEGQRVGEAVLSLPVEDLDQFVVASFPEGVQTTCNNSTKTASHFRAFYNLVLVQLN